MDTRLIALTSSFAALYVVMSILPGIPVVGFPGIKIQLEASAASVFGMILGSYAGASAAFIGTIISFFFGGASPLGLPFIFCPALNAFVVGLIFKNRLKIASALFAAIIAAFWLTPVAHPVIHYWYVGLAATFDKIIALLLIVFIAIMSKMGKIDFKKVEQESLGKGLTLLLLVSFIGNEADSALGNTMFAIPLIYEVIFGLKLETVRWLFIVSPLVYPIIRGLQALIAASIGLPLIRALRARGWVWT